MCRFKRKGSQGNLKSEASFERKEQYGYNSSYNTEYEGELRQLYPAIVSSQLFLKYHFFESVVCVYTLRRIDFAC